MARQLNLIFVLNLKMQSQYQQLGLLININGPKNDNIVLINPVIKLTANATSYANWNASLGVIVLYDVKYTGSTLLFLPIHVLEI